MSHRNPPPQKIPLGYRNKSDVRDYEERQKEVIRLLYEDSNKGTKVVEYSAKTGDYTITDSDYLIEVTSGSPTITLPSASTVTGQEFVVKNSGGGSVIVTGSENIDDDSTQILTQYDAITVISNGTVWVIV